MDRPDPLGGPRRWLLVRLNIAWLMFAAALAVLGPIFWVVTAIRGIGGLDFISFYATSAVFLRQGPLHAFDLAALVRAQSELAAPWGGQPFLPNLYPPFWVAAQSWLALLPLRWAYVAWGLATMAAGLAALVLLAGAAGLGDRRRWAILVGAGFLPLIVNLVQGQTIAFVLLPIALAMWLWTAGREGLAGAALGLVLIKPQLALPLVLLPFLRRSRPAMAGLLVTVLGLLMISLAVFGPSGVTAWWQLLTDQAGRESAGTFFRPWFSLRGALVWAGLPIALQYGILAGLGLALAAALALWRADVHRDIAAATAGALLITPHANAHDLALLVVPGMVIAGARHGRGLVAAAYVGATAAIWLPAAAPLAALGLLGRSLRLRLPPGEPGPPTRRSAETGA